jgi:hypothetical protein
MTKTLPSGVYAPLPVFFSDDDKLGKSLSYVKKFSYSNEEVTYAEMLMLE